MVIQWDHFNNMGIIFDGIINGKLVSNTMVSSWEYHQQISFIVVIYIYIVDFFLFLPGGHPFFLGGNVQGSNLLDLVL